jgi:hypothetical protein
MKKEEKEELEKTLGELTEELDTVVNALDELFKTLLNDTERKQVMKIIRKAMIRRLKIVQMLNRIVEQSEKQK